jgi:uncharacterized membrane protein YcaP (DUF421 family)
MKKQDIEPWDWMRILFGEAPPEFLLEVLIRTSVVFLALLIIVRLMGKRMGGQLSIAEMAVTVTLGAIVSPAMQIPQLGVLMGIMILICALIFQRGLNLLEFKSGRIEEITQGRTSMVVKDGVIQLHEMKHSKISKQQLFSALRGKNVYNLGDVGRVYLEPCGIFSIYKRKEPTAGLPIFPPTDDAINLFAQQMADDTQVCASCGNITTSQNKRGSCKICSANTWMPATISIKSQQTNS